MPRIQVIKITDDLTGTEIPEDEAYDVRLMLVIRRGPEDVTRAAWELCLAETSKEKLLSDLKPFIGGAPEVPPEAVVKSSGKPKGADPRNVHIRAWWETLTPGMRVDLGGLPEMKTNRGRIPDNVVSAYDTAKPEGYLAPSE